MFILNLVKGDTWAVWSFHMLMRDTDGRCWCTLDREGAMVEITYECYLRLLHLEDPGAVGLPWPPGEPSS